MRGRKPKPTVLKFLQGKPGHRALPLNEPKLKPELPEPPEIIQGVALEEWHRITPLLHGAGLLTALDGSALAAYSQSYATWFEAQNEIRRSGTVIKSLHGQPMVSPYVKVANIAWQQRTRIKVPEAPPPNDPYTEWRNRKRNR